MAGTKIAIVRGLNDNKGKKIDENMPFFNYLTTTEGEASLQLAKQRLWLYNSIFPEKQKLWLKGKAIIENTLYNSKGLGVHGTTPFLGILEKELQFVGAAVKGAAKKTQAATKMYIGRKDLTKGYNLDLQTVGLQGINGEDTLFDDVFKAYKEANKGCFRLYFNNSVPYLSDEFVNIECLSRFNLMVKLNTMLPKNSHNGIYVFMPFEDANNSNLTPTTTAAKVNDHWKYFNSIQTTCELSKENLGTWLKNAVMHKNTFNGSESITPESNIQFLRNNSHLSVTDNWNIEGQNKIGFCFDLFTCGVLIVILIVCGKLLTGIIQVCKDKEPTAFQGLDNIATRAFDFAASGTDFKGIGTGTGGGNTGNDTKTQAQKDCEAKTGWTWNNTTKTCEKDEVPPQSGGFNLSTWVKENPLTAGLIGVGAGLALTAK